MTETPEALDRFRKVWSASAEGKSFNTPEEAEALFGSGR
jgi:hypothetical protein